MSFQPAGCVSTQVVEEGGATPSAPDRKEERDDPGIEEEHQTRRRLSPKENTEMLKKKGTDDG